MKKVRCSFSIFKIGKNRKCSCSCVFVGAEFFKCGNFMHDWDQNRNTWNVSSFPKFVAWTREPRTSDTNVVD